MKPLSAIIVILCFSVLTGCVNQFAVNYKDTFNGNLSDRMDRAEFFNGKPKLVIGKNPEEDNKDMARKGYGYIGYSTFASSKGTKEDALEVGAQRGAEIVIYYAQYNGSFSMNMPIITQNPNQTISSNTHGTMTGSGNIYGSMGTANYNAMANYSGTTTTVLPGGSSIYNIPITVHSFSFMATYWNKVKNMHMGAMVVNLPDDIRHKLNRNKGVIVTLVANSSPAFNANILDGDVLTKINGQEISDVEDYSSKIKQFQNQNVVVEFMRGTSINSVRVALR